MGPNALSIKNCEIVGLSTVEYVKNVMGGDILTVGHVMVKGMYNYLVTIKIGLPHENPVGKEIKTFNVKAEKKLLILESNVLSVCEFMRANKLEDLKEIGLY